ncbi:MAG TPA: S-adenosylmethionine:tRNA ribosyltransferase-isomerase [Puia sp.]|jgi:S-adenosylmethionine:tRNA ribosyltransferase-isomerase|nr:S-adenosylmethionine:tRNA ribosyltransferase-isomerase [Puia sp.]
MGPKEISIADYTYYLPESSIAWYPLAERDASRLLVYRGGDISETVYRDIAGELPAGTLLVFNNTRVVEARIVFQKPSGGKVEIFCLEPPAEYGGMAAAMAQTNTVRWKCLIGGASKWKAGQVLVKQMGEVALEARYLEKQGDTFLIELTWRPTGLSFAELLHRAGLVPLPPYIHRTPDASDTERYQTVYARYEGSVAAPTAGLHFTDRVLRALDEKGVGQLFVTLHVGAGTFLPVKAATLGAHVMHTEFILVTREAIGELRNARLTGKQVIAVGTTSARTVESLYWLGVKTLSTPGIGLSELGVKQWDAYETAVDVSPETALTALTDWMDSRRLTQLVTTTQLLITPGYVWRVVQGLITNFHQPESTLLLLVASLIGEDWRRVYEYALARGFRFLSYGDGCLFFAKKAD